MKTLEAAYIMPIIFIVTVAVITVSLNLYDEAILSADSYAMLTRNAESNLCQAYAYQVKYTKQSAFALISNHMLVNSCPTLTGSFDSDTLYIKAQGLDYTTYFSNYSHCSKLRLILSLKGD